MEWQPIETAPKDGKEVLVAGGKYSCEDISCEVASADFTGVGIAYWDSHFGEWAGDGLVTHYPTHWMPLPPPPNTGGKHECSR